MGKVLMRTEPLTIKEGMLREKRMLDFCINQNKINNVERSFSAFSQHLNEQVEVLKDKLIFAK